MAIKPVKIGAWPIKLTFFSDYVKFSAECNDLGERTLK